jgi:hypothetical protein
LGSYFELWGVWGKEDVKFGESEGSGLSNSILELGVSIVEKTSPEFLRALSPLDTGLNAIKSPFLLS